MASTLQRSRRGRTPPGAAATWLAVLTVGVFAWGVEHWRARASSRATRGERQRFHDLARCLLGPDGPSLVYRTDLARARLRALAMATPLDPAPTWIDRCVPLARELAVHGAEVDVTREVQRADTRVARRARDLALGVSRVGLVWQVRAGDPDADLEHIAELLARTATEIDLAGGAPPRDRDDSPVAEVPSPTRETRVDLPGAVPLPVGGPHGFFVGAPLPAVARVSLTPEGPRAVAVDPLGAVAWRVLPDGVVRLDPRDGRRDGLSPVRVSPFDGAPAAARVAGPPLGVDPATVALSATSRDGVLWLGEAIPGSAPVLARLPTDRPSAATAVRLGAVAALESGPPIEEDIAVGASEGSVFAAYTRHGPEGTRVELVRASGGARAAVRPVPFADGPWTLPGDVGLTLCAADGALWLVAASRDGWRVAELTAGGARERFSAARSGGDRYDLRVTARCEPHGALAYGADRPRVSPMVWCTRAQGCRSLPAVPSPEPSAMPSWVTRDATGRARTHAEWPLSVAALSRGAMVAARTAGSVVAVTRLDPGSDRWSDERVVFDAAATERGAVAQGAEVYSLGGAVLLAVGGNGALHLLRSEDGGARWLPAR